MTRKHPIDEYIYQEAKEKALCEPVELYRQETKKQTAIVCAWCPDKEERDREVVEAGLIPNHTICPKCIEIEMETIAKFNEILIDKE